MDIRIAQHSTQYSRYERGRRSRSQACRCNDSAAVRTCSASRQRPIVAACMSTCTYIHDRRLLQTAHGWVPLCETQHNSSSKATTRATGRQGDRATGRRSVGPGCRWTEAVEESNSEPKSLFLQRTRSAALEVGAECAMPPFLTSPPSHPLFLSLPSLPSLPLLLLYTSEEVLVSGDCQVPFTSHITIPDG